MVRIFVDQIFFIDPLRFFPGFLLLGGIAEDQKGSRKHILGEMQQFPHVFAVFHDITDIAGANPQAFRGGDCILGGNQRVIDGQQKIAGAGSARTASGRSEGIVPFFAVRAKGQHQICLGNKRLVVAEVGEPVFQLLVGHIQDRVELLVPGSGRHGSGRNNGGSVLRGNLTVFKYSDRFSVC